MGLPAPAFESKDTQLFHPVLRPDESVVITVDSKTSGQPAGRTGEAIELKA